MSKLSTVFSLALLAAMLWPSLALQAEQPATTEQREVAAEKTDREGAPQRRNPLVRPGNRTAQQLVGQVNQLREDMNKEIELTDEQKQKLDKLFGEYIQSLRAKKQEGAEGKEQDPNADIKLLRDQMREAREKGDEEGAAELREEVRRLTREREQTRTEGTKAFLTSVKAELAQGQHAKFDEIVSRIGLDGARRGGAEIGRLMRAIRDPKVKVSDEQLRRINEVIRSGFGRSDDRKMDREKMDESFRRVHEAIMKELSEDQRTAVEEILAQPEQEPAGRNRLRERGGRAAPDGLKKGD